MARTESQKQKEYIAKLTEAKQDRTEYHTNLAIFRGWEQFWHGGRANQVKWIEFNKAQHHHATFSLIETFLKGQGISV